MKSERWTSGYHGEDSLRAKAHKYIMDEMPGARGEIPESMSSRGHTKMRPFKKGGHAHHKHHEHHKHHHRHHEVDHHAGHSMEDDYREHGKHHGLHHTQTDLHLPHVRKSRAIKRVPLEHADHAPLRRGGHADHNRLNVETVREYEHEGMKRGGHGHHHKHHAMKHEEHAYAKKHGKHHKGIGGLLGGLGGLMMGGPLGALAGSSLGSALPFRKGGHTGRAAMHKKELAGLRKVAHEIHEEGTHAHGGHAHHHRHHEEHMKHHRHHGHKKHHKAAGGTVYEHQMVGERPSHKAHHFNYESEMMGEYPVSKPRATRQSKAGLHDANHGQLFKKGGHSHSRHHHHKMAEGGMKMAAGGVGKIRHNQATSAGQPRGAKRVIRNNLF